MGHNHPELRHGQISGKYRILRHLHMRHLRHLDVVSSLELVTVLKVRRRRGFMYFSSNITDLLANLFLPARISSRLRKFTVTPPHSRHLYVIRCNTGLLSFDVHSSVNCMLQLIQANSHTSHRPSSSTYIPTSTRVATCVALGHVSSARN